jgi:hypothetical protein
MVDRFGLTANMVLLMEPTPAGGRHALGFAD